MTKRKPKDRPYVANYPPLDEWLKKHQARCNWQVPTGDPDDPSSYVEHYGMPHGGELVVIVHADRAGWNVYVGSRGIGVSATLTEAERRLGLAT